MSTTSQIDPPAVEAPRDMFSGIYTRAEVITALTNGGHTVSKAIEIALDYERGDWWARQWVHAVQSPDWPFGRVLP